MTTLHILATGPLATVQDLGRPGYAHLGVPRSGAADRGALGLANRLVGNRESAAGIEVTLGGLRVRPTERIIVAVTGPPTTVRMDGKPIGRGAMIGIAAGAELSLDPPTSGCRNYVAVRGGLELPATLGSRATDTLSGLGPAPLAPGDRLVVGTDQRRWPRATMAPLDSRRPDVVALDVFPGPRRDLVAEADHLARGVWVVDPNSNRVGVRLDRATDSDDPLIAHRKHAAQLRSEGIAHGAVQIPPSGRPVIFLADHPVTGGYPVVAVLTHESIDAAAQLVAGDRVRFRSR